MTNRSDPNSNSSSNQRPLHPRDERETLSALFDGELPGDATRFVLKRLDRDAELRETCGRWQMIGDALRGEATSAAPSGFANGVMRMLDAEAQAALVSSAAESTMAPAAAASSRRRWIGGAALAASVAMAAVLVVRPVSDTSSTATGTRIASGVAAPAATEVPAVTPTKTPAAASANNNPTTSIATAKVPSTTANHRVADRSRSAARTARGAVAPVRDQAVESPTAVAAAAPVTTGRPFHPPVDDIVTRPWPRSVLAEDTAASLTVGFGSSSTGSPSSLYPFEPRLPDSQPARPSTDEPQR